MEKLRKLIIYMLISALCFSVANLAGAGARGSERIIPVPGSAITLRLWEEPGANGTPAAFYEITQNGQSLRTTQASYELGLTYSYFDPLQGLPAVDPLMAADENSHLYIVQFVTQPLEEFRQAISDAGGIIRNYIAQFAYLVELDEVAFGEVAQLPYVRWIGPYHPAYRLENVILQKLAIQGLDFPAARYNIMVHDIPQKAAVAGRIPSVSGIVNHGDAGKWIVEATLTPEQLLKVARWDEVNFIDTWSPLEPDMDIVRQIGGANYIEIATNTGPPLNGFSGEDVRGEAFDAGCMVYHQEFAATPLLVHGTVTAYDHGTATAGVCFASGVNPQARGLLPQGQGIVASNSYWGQTGANRYICSRQLVQSPYFAVFQTSSVGSDWTTTYTTISAEADARCFDFDLIHCQSQSNNGTTNSRPEAWGKNIVSGGGINHYNTLDRADDMWNSGSGGASIGPASDGRIKPTFTHFNDLVWTCFANWPTGYGQFSGTSSATPIIAGHVGLVFQMWDAGIFGNTVIPGGSVFENRCHAATARALLIASAYQYPFTGTTGDKTRMHQGWGMPDVQKLYNMRNNLFIVDEDSILTNLQSDQYQVTINTGTPELKIAMVYSDPPGNPANQSQHRKNDLTLKVTSPGGSIYWGNGGLDVGVWSTTGGSGDTKNTEECVFVQNPPAGQWTVEVSAPEIVADGHTETPAMDADYALVVSGVGPVVMPNLDITLTPTNPPINIGPSGGSFNFNIHIVNNSATPATFDGWIKQLTPSGAWQQMLGPVLNITLGAGGSLLKNRVQNVPDTAQPGTYTYRGYVGYYNSDTKLDSSSFNYTKTGSGDAGPYVDNWDNYGDSFEPNIQPTAWAETPTTYSLRQNYPNPFNPTTTFEFELPQAGQVHLAVYDINGRLVSTLANGHREAGVHKITFDGSGLASGVYIYQMKAGEFSAAGKMIMTK